MAIEQYMVCAFTNDWRGGNPAAVCLLREWLPDSDLQKIACTNHVSETAFIVVGEGNILTSQPHRLRWFTPTNEVALCGHATLATAFVLYHHLGVEQQQPIAFETASGPLHAHRVGDRILIQLPASEPQAVANWPSWVSAIDSAMPECCLAAEDYLLVYSSPEMVEALTPDFGVLSQIDRRGVIVTAATMGKEDDFVSRFFVPKLGVNEDPVTGSAHCQLIPYWSRVLGKTRLSGWQASSRGGRVIGEWSAPWVLLEGSAVTFSTASLSVP